MWHLPWAVPIPEAFGHSFIRHIDKTWKLRCEIRTIPSLRRYCRILEKGFYTDVAYISLGYYVSSKDWPLIIRSLFLNTFCFALQCGLQTSFTKLIWELLDTVINTKYPERLQRYLLSIKIMQSCWIGNNTRWRTLFSIKLLFSWHEKYCITNELGYKICCIFNSAM